MGVLFNFPGRGPRPSAAGRAARGLRACRPGEEVTGSLTDDDLALTSEPRMA